MANIAIIYHSGFGHTQKQAEAILKGALSISNIQAELFGQRFAKATLRWAKS